ncbi:hypothetical protein QH639_19360 [Lysinibacillus sp. 1 U-2021]|uniref:hypothetical protein n=1 Tax=Lysinibacillus sp. 1 U-2021 TaxID=3039426 RepID=UPI002480D432|nr:hypothetical protein [Lysinibacillus sp. 1 U-2021]WGT37962.1 hypothetical protein QH639_19360 [Lysinibacillus sp. 1 U-2021]
MFKLEKLSEVENKIISKFTNQELVKKYIDDCLSDGYDPDIEDIVQSISYTATGSFVQKLNAISDLLDDSGVERSLLNKIDGNLQDPSYQVIDGTLGIIYELENESYIAMLYMDMLPLLSKHLKSYFGEEVIIFINGSNINSHFKLDIPQALTEYGVNF